MSYALYLGGIKMPVMPESISVVSGDRSQTAELASDIEALLLHRGALKTIRFTLRLSQTRSNKAFIPVHEKKAGAYLDYLAGLQDGKKPFYFTLARQDYTGKALFTTDLCTVISSYEILEDAKNGLDILVRVVLREYIKPGETTSSRGMQTAPPCTSIGDIVEMLAAVKGKSYTVAAGDTLFSIAQKAYGNGALWEKIYLANTDKIETPSLLTAGTVLHLPPAT